jgi:FKBP-type peptidyl-prolyl cis-trans isomerase 2
MLKVEIGDIVKVHFTCKASDGAIIESSLEKESVQLIIGSSPIMKGLEEAIIGMELNESKTVRILSAEAIHSYNKSSEFTVNKNQLPPNMCLEVGQTLDVVQENNEVIHLKIVNISSPSITLIEDTPPVNKDLIFDIKIEAIEKIRQREIVSLLCPTRGRPDNVMRLLRSILKTAIFKDRIEILFYIDMDDSRLRDYQQIFDLGCKTEFSTLLGCEAIWGEPTTVSKCWNTLAERCKGSILALANDDQVYVDKGWDIVLDFEIKKFPDKIFCMWFNDGINGPNFCAFPIISRKWYETLGYFTPHIFKYFYVDTWIMDVAKRIDRLHHIPYILVEHMHFTQWKSPYDETYRRNRSEAGLSFRNEALFEQTAAKRQEEAVKLLNVIEEFKKEIGGS